MFYKDLPKELFKKFDGYYDNRKYSINRHTEIFNDEVDKYFYKAQEKMLKNKNKHFKWVQKNKKYKYEDRYTYLEQEGNLIIAYTYWLDKLINILFYDLTDDSQYAYTIQQFQLTGINMMMDPSNSFQMSSYNHWGGFYNHKQILIDKNSMKILKSIPRLKYLPIEKLERYNFYHLLNANEEYANQWEILIKMGAIKYATELALNGRNLERKRFKQIKNMFKDNPSAKKVNDKLGEIRAEEYRINGEQERRRQILTTKQTDEQTDEQIKELIEGYSSLKNVWIYKDFIFRLPTDLDDVKNEGTKLNHCIYQQRKRYFQEGILIVFMRTKNEPEEPFFTLEINSDGISQIRTENNQTNSNITSIAEEWLNVNQNDLKRLLA